MVRANGVAMHVQQLAPDDPPADQLAGDASRTGPPTAVLIHGIATDNLASWYLSLAYPLASAGFRVVMYDLRGHGRSDRPPTGYRVDDLVDDLAALLDELGIAGPVHLLGNSLGGTIAFGYAVRHPGRVASIVAVEAAPATTRWLTRIRRQLAAALGPTRPAAAPGGPGARYLTALRNLVATTSAGQDLPASTPLAAADLHAIDCPVLGVFGSESAAADLAPSLVHLLPQARVVVIQGHRHAVLVTGRDQVRDQVLPWLLDQLGSGPGPTPGGSPAGASADPAGMAVPRR
ncbi:alpha/beta fold hydrolase [Micromonospora sp. NBC_01813]|uniref:alpha/beta fold hydrolase n=1 Tax=Micromonospora sp. NBC_01813 TaxID=2975988 RepID=UPI002DDA835B|nr:alpha/beta hydrolase [Micromonospora sp. NBC_01813]WSA12497.1 alpha/beta hydrolase [Micromonospora sp. NBC_01813]